MVFWLIVSIIFGLLFWSFWSVILSRWAKSKTIKQSLSILFWRSECPNCKTVLQPRDLIPLISFLIQGWKCRYCKKEISRFYPILELGSAVVFGFVRRYFYDQWAIIILFRMFTWWALWLMIIYSVLWYEIHFPLLIFCWILLVFAMKKWIFLRDALRWWVALFFIFLLLYFISRQLVKFRYHVNEAWLGIWDILVSPYLWTLLFAGLWSWFWVLDQILAILYFLIFTWCIGMLRYFLQTKKQTRRAYRFLNAKIANQSLPLLPSMVIAVALILVFKETLFRLIVF